MSSRKKVEEDNEINMTPMLDVVFIMLIFFIVTATFIKDTGADPNKPESLWGEKNKATILIAVSDKGKIWVEGRQVELGALQSVIARLYAENPKGSISIQADVKSAARNIVDVIAQAKAAGVENIRLSIEPI